MKNKTKLLTLFLCMCMILTAPAFAGMDFTATATNDLTMSFVQRPEVDVVLTVGNSDQDISSFEDDLMTKLAEKNIDPESVNIQAIETTTVSTNGVGAKAIFDTWYNYPSIVGGWKYTESTQSVGSSVNTSWTGFWKDASTEGITMECDLAQLDAFTGTSFIDNDTMGLTFRMNYGGTLDYTVPGITTNLNDYSYYFYATDGGGIMTPGLYRKDANEYFRGHILQADNWYRRDGTWYKIKIVVDGANIKVYKNDGPNGEYVEHINYTDPDPLPAGGYGVFTYSQSNGNFKNFSIISESFKRFSEVIREPAWRSSAERFVVNVDDQLIGDFEDEMALSEILYRTINEDIHYIGWGNNGNQDQANAFIADNNDMGTFVNRDTTAYSDAIDQIANYIAGKVNQKTITSGVFDPANPKAVGTFIAGDPISIEVNPFELKTNTVTTEYPNGRWRVDHDPNYYATPGGTMWWDNSEQDDLPDVYTQPGEYDFYFEDTLISKVNFHRKPVAKFVFNSADNTITDLSYDLDGEIIAHAWKWKEVTATSSTEVSDRSWIWREPTAADFVAGHEYIVQLRVLDDQDTWSATTSKYISTTTTIASVPIADFDMTPDYLQKHLGTTVVYTDKSYDPQGHSITAAFWTVYGADGTKIYEGSEPMTDFASVTQGSYTVQLKVMNELETWSEVYTKTLTVVDDEKAPTIAISEAEGAMLVNPFELTLTFADEGGSGFKRQSVTLTNATTGESIPLGWSSAKLKTVALDQDGVWSITAVAEDQKGNTTTQTFSGYIVDATAPTQPVISGVPTGWTSHDVTVNLSGSTDANLETYQYAISKETPAESAWITGTAKTITVAGEHHIWARAVDRAGNVSPTADIWAKIDKTAPVYTLMPMSRSMEVGSAYVQDSVEAEDPESGIVGGISIDASAVKTDVLGKYLVIYWIKNGAGTMVPSSQMISVVDTTAPVLSLVGDASVDVEVKTSYADAGATATDNYELDAAITKKIVPSHNILFGTVGTYAVTYNVSDESGNAATPITRTVNVVDTTKPVLKLVGDKSVDVEVKTSYRDAGATATDNYDATEVISANVTSSGSVDLNTLGSYTITYDVVDSEGNKADTIQRIVNVVDTTAPVIEVVGSNPVDTEVHLPYADAGAEATDNYDDKEVITKAITASDNMDLHTVGAYTVTYNVTDAKGNIAEAKTRTVNVVDTTAPVLALIGDESVDVEVKTSYTDAGATATDNYDDSEALAARISSSSSVDLDLVGSYAITYDVSDVSSNAAVSIQRTVNVVDTTKPVLHLTGSSSVEVEVKTSYRDAGATATDNYDATEVISATVTSSGSVDLNKVGSYTITYGVVDSEGNIADSIQRIVNVVDTTVPVITVSGVNPVDTEVHLPYVDAGAEATDNYDGKDAITAAIKASNNLDLHTLGAYSVIYNVTDANDNAAEAKTRTVNVVDTTVPVLALVGASSVDVEVHTSYTDAGATATDNYDSAEAITARIASTSSVNLDVVGSYAITYDVSDVSSNAAVSIKRTVNVVDTTKPVLELLGDAEIFMDQGDPYADAGAKATDNYDSETAITAAIQLTNPLNTGVIADYTLRYDVTDFNGNTADPIERVIHVIHPLAVSTQEPEKIGSYQATFMGAIDHYGVKPVLEHGFVYDRSVDLTSLVEAEGVLQLGAKAEADSFKAEARLSPGTTYYVRAYAIKAEGVVYGDAVEFRTQPAPMKPVTTQNFSDTSVHTVHPDRLNGHIKTDEAGITSFDVEKETEATTQLVQIPLPAVDQINAIAIQDGGKPELHIGTPIGTMNLPTENLGSSSLIPEDFSGDPETARLHVTIERVDEERAKAIEEATGASGLVAPIRFDLTLKTDEQIDERTTRVETTPIDAFENLVVRTIAAPKTEFPLMAVVFDEEVQEWLPVLSRTIIDENGDPSVEILHREMGIYTLMERKPVEVLGLEGSDAKEAIETLASLHVLPYEQETLYEPNTGVTRAEMAYTMVRLMGITQAQGEAVSYSDVAGQLYSREIQLATQSGVFTGYDDGLFRGDQVITREEIAAVIERAVKYVEMTEGFDSNAAERYSDLDRINDWAVEDIGLLTDAGVIYAEANDSFRPLEKATKAEVATILANFLKLIGME